MKRFSKTIISISIGAVALFLIFGYTQKTQAAPLLANYYLSQLPHDHVALDLFAKNNLLIISPEQALTHKTELDYIKNKNPQIIILAYVPSQSYNTTHWPNDPIFKNFTPRSEWWLRDGNGQTISFWPNLPQFNMNLEFSDYLLHFINTRIAILPNIDGIFFDMVSDGISWSGPVDLNNDGINDDKKEADKIWAQRVTDFLQSARATLHAKYIVINGNSNPKFQPLINGRMFESFPASWDWMGNWATIMNYLVKGKNQNVSPPIVVINSGTNNTGNNQNYQAMRFGLTSSMLEDNVYFSFDFGDSNHGQNWQYDEYDLNLGAPAGKSQSITGKQIYNNEVWRRDYDQGVVLVNPTNNQQYIDLGADYEKFLGKQDVKTNNGEISDQIILPAKDGILMLKTTQSIKNNVFGNGNFLRFYDIKGQRARNGYFSFTDGVAGGSKVYLGDLDNNPESEKITATLGRLEIFNSLGQHWFDNYPFGGDYSAEMRLAVGKLQNDTAKILISPASGGFGILYNYYGEIIKEKFYPFGEKYKGGFYGALGDMDKDGYLEAVIGTAGNRAGEVLVFNNDLQKIKLRFYPFGKKYWGRIKVAVGDVNGDGPNEILAMGNFGKKQTVRIFNLKAKKIAEFSINSLLGDDLNISTGDVNLDGKDEIIIENN